MLEGTLRKTLTCIGKGGSYQMVGGSTGLGLNAKQILVYQDTVTGQFYHRTPEDFVVRMEMTGLKPASWPILACHQHPGAEAVLGLIGISMGAGALRGERLGVYMVLSDNNQLVHFPCEEAVPAQFEPLQGRTRLAV
jgi:hypothetical protein